MDAGHERLSNHFIVCAYGRVGRSVARELEGEGVPFIVLDRRADLEPVMQRDGVRYVIADPTGEAALVRAGIAQARALISAVDSDADNVYITLTARALNPSVFIVARASNASVPPHLYRSGADRVISPYLSSGRHMAMLATRQRMIDYLEIVGRDDRPIRLEEMQVEADGEFIGKPLGDVVGESIPLVVRRATGEVLAIPDPVLALAAGDLILIMSAREDGRG